jgi:hypothetical protein
MKENKFALGTVVATPGSISLLGPALLAELLRRHVTGDWGDLDKEDKVANEKALKHQERILSSYDTEHGKFWIITEWDRNTTTVLLPSEY